MKFIHKSVLYDEALELLNCKPGDIVVDGTLGGGGHARGILERIAPEGMLIGVDRDPQALKYATHRLSEFGDSFMGIHGNFAHIDSILRDLDIDNIDAMILDIGVSSPQLDNAERGFTYREDVPLDMRMNPEQDFSAHDVVNNYSQKELTEIISSYGEERWASRIAEFIVRDRQIDTTGELVDTIKAAIPAGARRNGPHPAKRTFQAIRIEVNGELDALTQGIDRGIDVLKPGGRLCIISFHSLEDRIVKRAFKKMEDPCICAKDAPICVCGLEPKVKVLTRKPIMANKGELAENPRARSARLRACEKL